MRVAVNDHSGDFNNRIAATFGWPSVEPIEWRSPLASDGYAEYFDESFLERLGATALRVPLAVFWPRSGPRWDALGRTASGKLILVEAKAYIEEGIDYSRRASGASMDMIRRALTAAKAAFRADERAAWEQPFYQYANRLAHLFFLHELNGLDAYLVFLYLADAPDVPSPASEAEWLGASRVTAKALGIERHRFQDRVGTIIVSVPSMIAGISSPSGGMCG